MNRASVKYGKISNRLIYLLLESSIWREIHKKIFEVIKGENFINLMKNINPEIQETISKNIKVRTRRKLHQAFHKQISKAVNKKKKIFK